MADIVWKILVDCFVMVCLGFPIMAIELWVEPYRRGFFVNDLSIRLPFKEQSIPEVWGSVPVAIMLITIILTEIVRDRNSKNRIERYICSRRIPGWVWEIYCCVGVFLFGLACQHLLIFTTKTVVGRLRPHFYHVCMPVYNATAPANIAGYIQDYTCQTPRERMKDAHRSFPSGHSGFSIYCAVFFVLYVQAKGKWRGSKLLRHALQFAALLAGWYVALTRVQEHYHFWSDVAAGGAIGGVFAALVFIYVLKPRNGVNDAVWDREAAPQNVLPRPVLAR